MTDIADIEAAPLTLCTADETSEREAVAWSVNFTIRDVEQDTVGVRDWADHLGADRIVSRGGLFPGRFATCAAA